MLICVPNFRPLQIDGIEIEPSWLLRISKYLFLSNESYEINKNNLCIRKHNSLMSKPNMLQSLLHFPNILIAVNIIGWAFYVSSNYSYKTH